MSTTSPLSGKVAAVTGAGSGIGRAVALELARRGVRLALGDVNETGLAETVAQVEELGAECLSARVDVSDPAAVRAFAAATHERYGVVHQIYNNAGIAGDKDITDPGFYAAIERLLSVNLWGVIHGTTEFLPHLIASGDGHLVNVSSLNGLAASPGMPGYVTTKFAVRGFTEAVHADLLFHDQPVKVSTVYPGGVKTNIANAALEAAIASGDANEEGRERTRIYNDTLLVMPPADAATTIVDGVERGDERILIGEEAFEYDELTRAHPGSYVAIANETVKEIFASLEPTAAPA
jgi:NAD(P)-dependent dehydrogenase (short-subunit alcohol dehydrogenase family)